MATQGPCLSPERTPSPSRCDGSSLSKGRPLRPIGGARRAELGRRRRRAESGWQIPSAKARWDQMSEDRRSENLRAGRAYYGPGRQDAVAHPMDFAADIVCGGAQGPGWRAIAGAVAADTGSPPSKLDAALRVVVSFALRLAAAWSARWASRASPTAASRHNCESGLGRGCRDGAGGCLASRLCSLRAQAAACAARSRGDGIACRTSCDPVSFREQGLQAGFCLRQGGGLLSCFTRSSRIASFWSTGCVSCGRPAIRRWRSISRRTAKARAIS